jgi:DNA (cytosine-5)-methyltransferase 1
MKPTVASLFCGIGGLDLGFEWAGCEVVWASDLSPIAGATYSLNFGRSAVVADVLELSIEEIPDTDIVIGGPPCQSFSLVGQRRADDPRGKLVFRFLEIIAAKRPRGFVMENVPGMASAMIDGERLPVFLARSFRELGYHVTVMKLNAADYLVPQLRKRIFIVGSLHSPIATPDPVEFALDAYGIDVATHDNGTGAALLDLGEPTSKHERAAYRSEGSPFSSIMRGALDEVELHERPRMSTTDLKLVSFIPPGGNYRDVPDEHSTHRIMRFKETGGRTSTYGRLHPDRPSFTVNTYFRRPNVGSNFHPVEDRLITVREAMRLQSLPDRFLIAPSGAQDARNALIGNAVPPLLAHAVAREVLRSLDGEKIDLSPDCIQSHHASHPALGLL